VPGALDHGLQHRQFVAGDTYIQRRRHRPWRHQAIGANLDKSHPSLAGTPKSRCGPPSLPLSLTKTMALTQWGGDTLPSSPRTVGDEHVRLFRVGQCRHLIARPGGAGITHRPVCGLSSLAHRVVYLRCWAGGFQPVTASALHGASLSSVIKNSAKAVIFAGRARAVGVTKYNPPSGRHQSVRIGSS
jgi:hypothetical protein